MSKPLHRFQKRTWFDDDEPVRTVCPKCGAHSSSAAKVRRHYEDWHRGHWEYRGPTNLDDEYLGVYGQFSRAQDAVRARGKIKKRALKRHVTTMKQRLRAAGVTRRRAAEGLADIHPRDDEPDEPTSDRECDVCRKKWGGYHFHDWNDCPLNPEND